MYVIAWMEKEFHHIYNCIKSLTYTTEPDYSAYRNMLNSVLINKKLSTDLFDWEQGGRFFQHVGKINQQPFTRQMKASQYVVRKRWKSDDDSINSFQWNLQL